MLTLNLIKNNLCLNSLHGETNNNDAANTKQHDSHVWLSSL